MAFVKGTFEDYCAKIDFNLNFEDANRAIRSVRVRVGDMVSYDGDSVHYTDRKVGAVTGRCPSLKSAIVKLGWLVPRNGHVEEPVVQAVIQEAPKEPPCDYDPLKGGNADTQLRLENAGEVTKRPIIRRDDQVVKTIPKANEPQAVKKPMDLTVSAEQVAVKTVEPVRNGPTLVTSSTSLPRSAPKMARPTGLSGNYNSAAKDIPLKGVKKTASQSVKTYKVDDTTRVPEDATLSDVRKATKVIAAEGQQGIVVKKIAGVKQTAEIPEKVTASVGKLAEESITTTVGSPEVDSPEIMIIKGKGANKEIETMGEKKVIGKIGQKKPEPLTTNPETEPVVEGLPQEPVVEDQPVTPAVTVDSEPPLDIDSVLGTATTEKKASSDYLSMLPKNWAGLHWTQKEKFVQEQTDTGLIKYIRTVENTAAVIKACNERLKALGAGK